MLHFSLVNRFLFYSMCVCAVYMLGTWASDSGEHVDGGAAERICRKLMLSS